MGKDERKELICVVRQAWKGRGEYRVVEEGSVGGKGGSAWVGEGVAYVYRGQMCITGG